jgi:hypothetical protein
MDWLESQPPKACPFCAALPLDETPFLSVYTAHLESFLSALASRAGKPGRVASLGKFPSLFDRGKDCRPRKLSSQGLEYLSSNGLSVHHLFNNVRWLVRSPPDRIYP